MEHIVYLDPKAKEMEKLLAGSKTMIVRGGEGRVTPYGIVHHGETLYFINAGSNEVKAKARVKRVIHGEKLSEHASADLLQQNHAKLQLTGEQIRHWAGKRYLVLVEVAHTEPLTPFMFDKSPFKAADDWLLVDDIRQFEVAKIFA